MAIGTKTWEALSNLSVSTAMNRDRLERTLGGVEVFQDLLGVGHLASTGGRFERTPVSKWAVDLFEVVPPSGARISNAKAQATTGLLDMQYDAAKRVLLSTGEIERGQGQGGTIKRASGVVSAARGTGAVRERDLYRPFKSYLDSTAVLLGQTFRETIIVGDSIDRRNMNGQWSNPDAVTITVTEMDLLPSVDVSLQSYEIKKSNDAANLLGVYEAAAHQRWAHYSTLVIEYPLDDDLEPPASVLSECQRHGVGLMRIWNGQCATWLDPERQNPSPLDVNQFVKRRLPDARLAAYKKAIGK